MPVRAARTPSDAMDQQSSGRGFMTVFRIRHAGYGFSFAYSMPPYYQQIDHRLFSDDKSEFESSAVISVAFGSHLSAFHVFMLC